jgi:hypothetical protein
VQNNAFKVSVPTKIMSDNIPFTKEAEKKLDEIVNDNAKNLSLYLMGRGKLLTKKEIIDDLAKADIIGNSHLSRLNGEYKILMLRTKGMYAYPYGNIKLVKEDENYKWNCQ